MAIAPQSSTAFLPIFKRLAPYPLMAILIVILPLCLADGTLGDAYLGAATPDLYDHIFLFEWFRQAFFTDVIAFQTQSIAAPTGGAIIMPDPLGGMIYSLFAPLFGQVLAFNLTLITAISWGVAAAYYLARTLGQGPAASLFAAVLYGGSAYTFAQLQNGETETLQLFAMPLAFAALYPLIHERPNATKAVGAGLALALSFFAAWYYGAYTLMATGAFCLFYLGRSALRGLNRIPFGHWGGAALIASLAIAPMAWALYQALYGGAAAGAALFKMPSILELVADDHLSLASSSTDLARLFAPGSLTSDGGYIHGGFLGPFALFSAALGLILHVNKSLVWGVFAALTLLLSLGPILFFDGHALTLAGQTIALPYWGLARVIPFFEALRLPYRFLVLTQLALAMMAGWGLEALLQKQSPRRGLGLALLLSLMAQIEVHHFSGLAFPASTTPLSTHPLAHQPSEGGILLDLPMRFNAHDLRGHYLAMQPSHGYAIPYSLMSSQLAWALSDNPFLIEVAAMDRHHRMAPTFARYTSPLQAFSQGIEGVLFNPDYQGSDPVMRAGIQDLKSIGISRIVLHKTHLNPEDFTAIAQRLKAFLGNEAPGLGGALIYEL